MKTTSVLFLAVCFLFSFCGTCAVGLVLLVFAPKIIREPVLAPISISVLQPLETPDRPIALVPVATLAPLTATSEGRAPESITPKLTATLAAAAARIVDAPQVRRVPYPLISRNNPQERLYFSVAIENMGQQTVQVGVSFRAYKPDGTLFSSCIAPSGTDGPGVTISIAPRERAIATCPNTIAPSNLGGLQLTAKLWDVVPLAVPEQNYELLQAGMRSQESNGGEMTYQPYAVLRGTRPQASRTTILFRFYDDQNVQVGTCVSAQDIVVQPGINQEVHCSSPLVLDNRAPQPIGVRAQPAPGP